MTGFSGSSFTDPVARSNSASTAIPTAPTCLPSAMSSGRTRTPVAPNASLLLSERERDTEDAVRDDLGQSYRRDGAERACASIPVLRADGKDRNDELLKGRATMVECQVTARPEDAAPCGEHKLQVRGVPQRRRRDTDASGWRRTPTSDPASPVQLDRRNLPARRSSWIRHDPTRRTSVRDLR